MRDDAPDPPAVEDAAIAAMDRGWPVFPVSGKKPATANGLHDASCDYGKLHGWWGLHPERGIGVPTGEPSGVWVLDLDGDEGRASVKDLQREHGSLPETVVTRTRRGWHVYFTMPDGVEIRNSAGKVAPGIDVRGTGGYVVIPPSPHPSGERYRWADGRSPEEIKPARPPAWLVELVTAERSGADPAPPVGEKIPSGERNATLCSLAGTMRRRGMEQPEIRAALLEANRRRCNPPLPESEVEKIAGSVSRYAPAPRESQGATGATWTEGGGLPEAIPAADALDEDPPSFLVDGFILKDETGLITGDGGVYKTSLGLAVAVAVAVGEPLFGRFEVQESGPVLVVSEEDGAGVLRNRLEAIARGHGWDVDEALQRVHLLALKGATLDSGEWREHLAGEADRIGAVLVVLDPYSRLTRAAENSTDENKENIAFMSRLNREGVTVALVHHAGKDYDGRRKIDRVRGASALNQAARWIYFLERNQLGVAVECLKMSRAGLPDRFVVEPDIEADPAEPTVWTEATFEYVTEDKAEEEEADRFILDNLRRYPGTNSTGLKELAKGTGINAVEVSAAIRRLRAVGKIDYEDGPRNAKEWYVTDRGDPAEKSPARSARYPADPAGTLPGKVEEDAAPCPSNKERAGSAGCREESRQGETESGPQPRTCPTCTMRLAWTNGDGSPNRLGPTAETCGACKRHATEVGELWVRA